jgi:hypothetical protein
MAATNGSPDIFGWEVWEHMVDHALSCIAQPFLVKEMSRMMKSMRN